MLSVIPVYLPARRPMDSINMFLIRQDPVTLIDAGLDNLQTEQVLEKVLKGQGLVWHDIRRVVITHTHPDHVGLAQKLELRCQADIFMHPLEWEKLQQGLADNIHIFRWAGIPSEYQKSSHPDHSDRPSSPAWFKSLNQGDTIPFAQGSLTVLHTPGHSSGQICLYEPDEEIMFTSDHLVPNFSPALLVEPGIQGLEDRTPSFRQYRESLITLSRFPMQKAYPGHGLPFADIKNMIQRKLDHSLPEKLNRIHGFLTAHPQTVFDLVNRMIPELPPALSFFACGDALAYLDQLVSDQRAHTTLEQDRILFYNPDS